MVKNKNIFDAWRADVATVLAENLPWENFSGAKILITGASGFLGACLVRCLLALHPCGKVKEPVSVIGLVRSAARAKERLADQIENPHLELIEWDLNQIAIPDIAACDYVIHAASQASPKFYGIDPVGTILPNAVGTAALLEAIKRGCPRIKGFLFVSSSEVYGQIQSVSTLTEDAVGTVDPVSVRSCYAESKRLGETLCVAWSEQFNIPTFIVRPFHTYGPGLQADDGRVFSDFVFNVVNGQNIVMKSDGAARRAFCYVTDAVAGFFTVLLKGSPAIPYNVANSNGELSVLELAELLVSLFPERQLKVERQFTQEKNSYLASPLNRLVPNVARIESLGWSAKISPEQGFRRMIKAYLV